MQTIVFKQILSYTVNIIKIQDMAHLTIQCTIVSSQKKTFIFVIVVCVLYKGTRIDLVHSRHVISILRSNMF